MKKAETAARQSKGPRQARLVLEDGSEYVGWSFGRGRSQAGEVVFNTGMAGYPQSLTDPSYRGQILVSTYPLVGNYGVPVKPKTCEAVLDEQGIPAHFESPFVQVSGFVVSELCEEPSHFASGSSLSAWLDKNNIPGISGIDTRALTERLREHGVMRGKILVEGSREVTMDSGVITNPVADVSNPDVKTYRPVGAPAAAVGKTTGGGKAAKEGLPQNRPYRLRRQGEHTPLPPGPERGGRPASLEPRS